MYQPKIFAHCFFLIYLTIKINSLVDVYLLWWFLLYFSVVFFFLTAKILFIYKQRKQVEKNIRGTQTTLVEKVQRVLYSTQIKTKTT
jgi:hypothetical protein